MQAIVFYSWQSDLPNTTNRGFIEEALRKATKRIRDDESIQVEPVLDRDTSGVPGSPDIALTIFEKISNAQVFVCDISIIGGIRKKGKKKRYTPNPNVLVELGYALRALTYERVIMVMNTAYGIPENLPFDLNKKRVIPYTLLEAETNRSEERKKLENMLHNALHTIFSSISISEVSTELSLAGQAREALLTQNPNRRNLLNTFLTNLCVMLKDLNPDYESENEQPADELLVTAIEQTADIVYEFAYICEAVASTNDSESAELIHRSFEKIITNYYLPKGVGGHFYDWQFDFYKFIGHEFFVVFCSFLIRYERWDTLAELLATPLFVDNWGWTNKLEPVFYQNISSYTGLLDTYRRERLQTNTAFLRAEILRNRYNDTRLSTIITFEHFIEADLFLYFRKEKGEETYWTPWSAVYSERITIPDFLKNSYTSKYAQKLLTPLRIHDMSLLPLHFTEKRDKLRIIFRRSAFFQPLSNFDPKEIGKY